MGIRGLMTYINRNSNFLEPYDLHGGYLVIDGHSLAAQLYISSRCNCAFGGDYDRYARLICEFFDELEKCEVTPLVILDGGKEAKKMKTSYTRMFDKLQSAVDYTPATQSRMKFMPMGTMMVFAATLKRKNIKVTRTRLEADPAIASAARALNCPVLSFDSDFYIFGVMYIPINTLEPFVVKSSTFDGYYKRCKLFKVENFLRTFPGLDTSVLPLAAILLGNDYVDSKVFKNFFNCLKLSNPNQRLFNEGQRKIDTTFRWLQNYKLNDAVAAILSKLPKKRRQKVLSIIELIVDSYQSLPCEILLSLGLPKKYEIEVGIRRHQRKFKFQGNVDALESRRLWRDEQIVDDESSGSDQESEKKELVGTSDVPDDLWERDETIDEPWPPWFALQSSAADFPADFIDLLHHRIYMVPVQIEDFKYPSACTMSLKIVRAIDGLLAAGRKEPVADLSYFIRDGSNFVRRHAEVVRGTESTIFPPFSDLRDTPMALRKAIFDDTLEISDKHRLINEIPAAWRTYVAAVSYWLRQEAVEPLRNSCHMHAVLFTMLFGVVDRTIGYHRSLNNFNKAYGPTLAEIETKRKAKTHQAGLERGESIIEALEAVTKDDCLVAAPFFINHFAMDQLLCECPRKFNVTIVHAFSQLQGCIKQAIQLNVLLGCPYEYSSLADFYNGTMLYNLYTNFKKRANAEAYIAVTLEHAPSLLHLYNLLIAKVKLILGKSEILENTTKGARKQKNKKKKVQNLDADTETEDEAEEESGETQTDLDDPQNSFSVLAALRHTSLNMQI